VAPHTPVFLAAAAAAAAVVLADGLVLFSLDPVPHLIFSIALTQITAAHRHLTDFKGQTQGIRLHTVSLSQMKPISPLELFTKLRTLAILVFSLLGAALVWSGAMMVKDVRDRKAILQELMRPGRGPRSCGFSPLPSGEWLWELPPAIVEPDGHLTGPFVTLASIIGVRRWGNALAGGALLWAVMSCCLSFEDVARSLPF
jgi:hypothetical protein